MASRHFSLEMTEVADVRDIWQAFELQNQIKLEVRLEVLTKLGVPDLLLTGIAHQNGSGIGDQPPLASVSVRCSAMNLKHLRDALTHVLYALDFKLALNEFEGTAPQKA